MNMTDTKKQLLPTEGDIMPTNNHIENLILDIRGQQVMLDRDLAKFCTLFYTNPAKSCFFLHIWSRV